MGITYSEIGPKLRRVLFGKGDGEGEGEMKRDALERDRERDFEGERASSAVLSDMRFSGTWYRTTGPRLGSKVA